MNNKENYYDLVCNMERISLEKRFLPYAYGSPKRTTTSNDQYERVNLLFFTDSHIDFTNAKESYDNLVRTVEYANTCPVKLSAVIHAGDFMTPWKIADKNDALNRAKSFFEVAKKSENPFVFAIGNHDYNDAETAPENALTDSDWSELFYDYAEEKYGIIRQIKKNGNSSNWHYYDVEDKKIRIIAIDSLDTDRSVTNENGNVKYFSKYGTFITSEQLNWIANTALNFDDKPEKDWGVILTSHMTFENFGYHANAGEVLHKILVAFNNSDKYSFSCKNDENSYFDIDLDADFTRYKDEEKKPHFICWLIGHEHVDKNCVRDGINMIWSLNGSASNNYGDARVMRFPGTATQNAFDIVNIDTVNRRIRMFRYGAGLNCYGEGGDRFLPDGLPY